MTPYWSASFSGALRLPYGYLRNACLRERGPARFESVSGLLSVLAIVRCYSAELVDEVVVVVSVVVEPFSVLVVVVSVFV